MSSTFCASDMKRLVASLLIGTKTPTAASTKEVLRKTTLQHEPHRPGRRFRRPFPILNNQRLRFVATKRLPDSDHPVCDTAKVYSAQTLLSKAAFYGALYTSSGLGDRQALRLSLFRSEMLCAARAVSPAAALSDSCPSPRLLRSSVELSPREVHMLRQDPTRIVEREREQRNGQLWTDSLELHIYEGCVQSVGIAPFLDLVSRVPAFCDELLSKPDLLAFVCLALCGLPAAELMIRASKSSSRRSSAHCESKSAPTLSALTAVGLVLNATVLSERGKRGHADMWQTNCAHASDVIGGTASRCPPSTECAVCTCLARLIDNDLGAGGGERVFAVPKFTRIAFQRMRDFEPARQFLALAGIGLKAYALYWRLQELSPIDRLFRSRAPVSDIRASASRHELVGLELRSEGAGGARLVCMGDGESVALATDIARELLRESEGAALTVYSARIPRETTATPRVLRSRAKALVSMLRECGGAYQLPVELATSRSGTPGRIQIFYVAAERSVCVLFPTLSAFHAVCRDRPLAMLMLTNVSHRSVSFAVGAPRIHIPSAAAGLTKALCSPCYGAPVGESRFHSSSVSSALAVLCRLLDRRAFVPSGVDVERALVLRAILVRLYCHDLDASECDYRVWKSVIQPLMQSESLATRTIDGRESVVGMAPAAHNLHTALRCFLSSKKDMAAALIHVRAVAVLRDVLSETHVRDDGSRVSALCALPALDRIVRAAEKHIGAGAGHIFVPFYEDAKGHDARLLSAADACRALYAICAADGILNREQAMTVFMGIRLRAPLVFPVHRPVFRKVVGVQTAGARVAGVQAFRRPDERVFFTLFRALLYLSTFSLDAPLDFIDSYHLSEVPVVMACPAGQVASACSDISGAGSARRPFHPQYRGTVTLGQMLVHTGLCFAVGAAADAESPSLRADKQPLFLPRPKETSFSRPAASSSTASEPEDADGGDLFFGLTPQLEAVLMAPASAIPPAVALADRGSFSP